MKSTRAAIGVITTITIVLGCSTQALADDSAHDKAVAAFQEGRKYIEAGNCDAAVTKLRESLGFEPSVGARLSIADCYEPNDPLSAWRALKDAANLAYINHDERLALAEARATALEKRLPVLHVNVAQATLDQPGFELRVDGEMIDKFQYKGGVIATKPGKHVVEASAPLRHFTQQVSAESGAVTQVIVQLERDACAAPPTPVAVVTPAAGREREREREAPSSTRRTLGIAIAGAGIAGLASGVVFGILTLNKRSTIQDLCGGNAGDCKAPPGSVDPQRDSATTTAAISTASFIAGGVAVLGGGLLYFTAPTSSSSSSATAPLRVAPRVSTTGAGMGLEGSF